MLANSRSNAAALAVLAALVHPGCVAPVESDSRLNDPSDSDSDRSYGTPVSEAELRELLPEDWAGYELGMPLPRAYHLGPQGTPSDLPPASVANWDNVVLEDDKSVAKIVAFRNRRMYRIEIDVAGSAALSRLADERAERALRRFANVLTEERAGRTTDREVGVLPQGLRIGGEDRIRYGIADGWSKDSWLATIGMLTPGDGSSQCTGTLISTNTILTAAHCVIGSGNVPKELTFVPRQDGASVPPDPYGTWFNDDLDRVFAPAEFISNNCGNVPDNMPPVCVNDDWALVTLTRAPEGDALGFFMRYAVKPEHELVVIRSRGYPVCGQPDSPTPECTDQTLYGVGLPCQVIPDFAGVDALYFKRVAHDCDGNEGQSGGPIYRYLNNLPTILGVDSSDCEGGMQCNVMRHVTPTMKAAIDSLAI